MFAEFRINVKNVLSSKGLTYYQLSECSGIAESTIKCFMCGANDSRRVAEKIADVLDYDLVYSNGVYNIVARRQEK